MTFQKHDSGKPPISYLGQFYPALGEVASLLRHGHEKYGKDDNWKHCPDLRRYCDALGRHYLQYTGGEKIDESGHHHLAAVVVNALFLLMLDKESDDA